MATALRDAFSVTRVSFWVCALLSSLVGSLLYLFTARSIEGDAEARFVSHARHAQSVINVRLRSYANLLRSTSSMIQSTPVLTHRNFSDFVSALDLPQHFPAVDYINFAVYVPQERRDIFEDDLSRNVSRIFGTPVELNISPQGARASYLVVAYIEPAPPGAGYYGIDLMANRYFGNQLTEQRDRGIVFSSGSPIPLLSQPNNIYLGVRTPVYRAGQPLDTIEARRAAYAGSLGIAFSVRKLLNGVMDEIPIAGLRMTLYDLGPGMDAQGRDASHKPLALFDSAGTRTDPAPPPDAGEPTFAVTLPLDFNGRLWKAVYSVRKSALYTASDGYYPTLMMAFGFIGSMLLYALLHSLTSSRRAALALAQDMTSELRDSQNKLQLAHQKLRRLADHAYQIKEMERKRIAREIHDDLGQSLLALRIEAELLAGRTRDTHSHLHKRARATLQQIDTTIKSVRQIINDLRPTVLDLGLSAAVEWQVNEFQRRTGIQCEVQDDHGELAVPDHCATAFFRILQESLANVVRHANATRVKVELRLNGDWLSLTVRDNGCGLPPGGRNKHGSFGLVGIEERIVILGGTCAVFSEPAGGTTVMVSAPVVGGPEPALPAQPERGSGSAVV